MDDGTVRILHCPDEGIEVLVSGTGWSFRVRGLNVDRGDPRLRLLDEYLPTSPSDYIRDNSSEFRKLIRLFD